MYLFINFFIWNIVQGIHFLKNVLYYIRNSNRKAAFRQKPALRVQITRRQSLALSHLTESSTMSSAFSVGSFNSSNVFHSMWSGAIRHVPSKDLSAYLHPPVLVHIIPRFCSRRIKPARFHRLNRLRKLLCNFWRQHHHSCFLVIRFQILRQRTLHDLIQRGFLLLCFLCGSSMQFRRNTNIECSAECLLRCLANFFAKFQIIIYCRMEFFFQFSGICCIEVYKIINSKDFAIKTLSSTENSGLAEYPL